MIDSLIYGGWLGVEEWAKEEDEEEDDLNE